MLVLLDNKLGVNMKDEMTEMSMNLFLTALQQLMLKDLRGHAVDISFLKYNIQCRCGGALKNMLKKLQ